MKPLALTRCKRLDKGRRALTMGTTNEAAALHEANAGWGGRSDDEASMLCVCMYVCK